MKKAKNTGAMVVSLLLAAIVVGLYVGVGAKLGLAIYKESRGEVSVETVQPEVEVSMQDEPSVEIEAPDGQETAPMYPERVELVKKYTDDYYAYAVVTGHFADGRTWEYTSLAYPETELEPIALLYSWEDTFVLNAGGEVIALDTATGDVKWTNAEFGGYSPACTVDEQRNLYLCGYYGPDVHIIDAEGKTVQRVAQLDANYGWAYGISKTGENTLEIRCALGPTGDDDYILTYDMASGVVTLPENSVQPEENLAWIEAYRTYLAREDVNYERGYALIYINDDDIPEMYAQGYQKCALICYNAEENSVAEYPFDGDDINYYVGGGIFSINSYDENMSDETFYRVENGVSERIGNAKMKHYDEREPDCWWDGEKMSSDDFFRKLNTFRPVEKMNAYPSLYPEQMLLAQLDNWRNPSDNFYWSWKDQYLEAVRENMVNDATFALVDVDENGLPELFVRFEQGGEVYTRMWLYNEQTQQCMHEYFSGDQVTYLPGEALLASTYTYGQYNEDNVYRVSDRSLQRVAYGSREKHSDGGYSCYYMGSNLSEKAYKEQMAPLFSDNAVRIADCTVLAEEILKVLK